MALKFKIGDRVRQVIPAPIEGEVVEATIVGDEVQFRVEWTNSDGHVQSKWFADHQVDIAEVPK